MTDIDTLIRDLETATGASRELDKEIADLTIGPDRSGDALYTGSLDAALSLVAEGWVWSVQIDYELPGRANLYNAMPGNENDPPVRVQADGAAPALALCIAALKARSVP